MSWRRFQDDLEDESLLRWRRVEDDFKTSSRPTNVCWVALEYNQSPLFVFADGLLLVTDCRIGSMATSWQTSSNNAFVNIVTNFFKQCICHFTYFIMTKGHKPSLFAGHCILCIKLFATRIHCIFGIGSWYLRRTASRNCCLIRM